MSLIWHIIYISLFCLGLRHITADGMIFGFVRKFAIKLQTDRPKWITWVLKPTIMCVVCYPSFWGTILYFVVFKGRFIYWPTAIISCSFINFFFSSLTEWIENQVEITRINSHVLKQTFSGQPLPLK